MKNTRENSKKDRNTPNKGSAFLKSALAVLTTAGIIAGSTPAKAHEPERYQKLEEGLKQFAEGKGVHLTHEQLQQYADFVSAYCMDEGRDSEYIDRVFQASPELGLSFAISPLRPVEAKGLIDKDLVKIPEDYEISGIQVAKRIDALEWAVKGDTGDTTLNEMFKSKKVPQMKTFQRMTPKQRTDAFEAMEEYIKEKSDQTEYFQQRLVMDKPVPVASELILMGWEAAYGFDKEPGTAPVTGALDERPPLTAHTSAKEETTPVETPEPTADNCDPETGKLSEYYETVNNEVDRMVEDGRFPEAQIEKYVKDSLDAIKTMCPEEDVDVLRAQLLAQIAGNDCEGTFYAEKLTKIEEEADTTIETAETPLLRKDIERSYEKLDKLAEECEAQADSLAGIKTDLEKRVDEKVKALAEERYGSMALTDLKITALGGGSPDMHRAGGELHVNADNKKEGTGLEVYAFTEHFGALRDYNPAEGIIDTTDTNLTTHEFGALAGIQMEKFKLDIAGYFAWQALDVLRAGTINTDSVTPILEDVNDPTSAQIGTQTYTGSDTSVGSSSSEGYDPEIQATLGTIIDIIAKKTFDLDLALQGMFYRSEMTDRTMTDGEGNGSVDYNAQPAQGPDGTVSIDGMPIDYNYFANILTNSTTMGGAGRGGISARWLRLGEDGNINFELRGDIAGGQFRSITYAKGPTTTSTLIGEHDVVTNAENWDEPSVTHIGAYADNGQESETDLKIETDNRFITPLLAARVTNNEGERETWFLELGLGLDWQDNDTKTTDRTVDENDPDRERVTRDEGDWELNNRLPTLAFTGMGEVKDNVVSGGAELRPETFGFNALYSTKAVNYLALAYAKQLVLERANNLTHDDLDSRFMASVMENAFLRTQGLTINAELLFNTADRAGPEMIRQTIEGMANDPNATYTQAQLDAVEADMRAGLREVGYHGVNADIAIMNQSEHGAGGVILSYRGEHTRFGEHAGMITGVVPLGNPAFSLLLKAYAAENQYAQDGFEAGGGIGLAVNMDALWNPEYVRQGYMKGPEGWQATEEEESEQPVAPQAIVPPAGAEQPATEGPVEPAPIAVPEANATGYANGAAGEGEASAETGGSISIGQ